jgi:hypothetical protein
METKHTSTSENILYFDKPGPQNTEAVLRAAVTRARQLNVTHVVVASTRGETALQCQKAFEGMGVQIVCVGEHAGFYGGGDNQVLTEAVQQELEGKGVRVFIGSHALSGVNRSITNKFGGISSVEIIAYTLRQFGGEGSKVAVEIAVMAADAGLIPTDREVIAIGGTGKGADTALVLKAAHMNNFFDLEVREIIAKPRQRKGE